MLTNQIGVRLKTTDKELLEKVCEARGEDVSDFVRRAIRVQLAELNFYPEETKKALGIRGEASPNPSEREKKEISEG
jgi:hypothetical protein